MKDPRATLYALLDGGEGNEELKTDVKAYFDSIIGQSATAKAEAAQSIASAQTGFDKQMEEFKAQAPKAPSGEYVSKAEFDALKKDYGTSQDIIEGKNKAERSQTLTTSLNGKFNNIDEDFRTGVVTSMKSDEGYTIGGKNYKATVDGESILISVDGESGSLDSGFTSIMAAGLSGKVVGAAGGGMPAFDANRQQNVALGFDADINADLKS